MVGLISFAGFAMEIAVDCGLSRYFSKHFHVCHDAKERQARNTVRLVAGSTYFTNFIAWLSKPKLSINVPT